MWKIRDVVAEVGDVVQAHLLFVHAWSGCDTTSATFGQGKTALLKKIINSNKLQQISCLMSNTNASSEQIGKAGIQVFIYMYGGKQEDSLNKLRYANFMDSCHQQKESLRVHLQVIIWKKLTSDDLDPKQWGLKLDGKVLNPIMTDIKAAPENLLKFVRCKCKLSSKNPCVLMPKNGLKCVTACEDCQGESCNNAEGIFEVAEETGEEENFDL